MLTAQELADRLTPTVNCPIADFIIDCTDDYLQPLYSLMYGHGETRLIGLSRTTEILKELGINVGQRRVHSHRVRECTTCKTAWNIRGL
jgi:hypothetical protein